MLQEIIQVMAYFAFATFSVEFLKVLFQSQWDTVPRKNTATSTNLHFPFLCYISCKSQTGTENTFLVKDIIGHHKKKKKENPFKICCSRRGHFLKQVCKEMGISVWARGIRANVAHLNLVVVLLLLSLEEQQHQVLYGLGRQNQYKFATTTKKKDSSNSFFPPLWVHWWDPSHWSGWWHPRTTMPRHT